jgi:Uma2 family endonuclease
MVEVLSPGEQNEQRDKEIKLKLYSRYGIQEYWIVNWQQQTLAIYRRIDAQLQLVATLITGDTLTSPLSPGFSTPVAQIFR